MDRAVDSGVPIVPPRIEIRDGGIFWSFDPDREIPRVDPGLDSKSQVLAQLRVAFNLLHQRRSSRNRLSENDRIRVMQYMKYKSGGNEVICVWYLTFQTRLQSFDQFFAPLLVTAPILSDLGEKKKA